MRVQKQRYVLKVLLKGNDKMITEQEFTEKFNSKKHIYTAWGEYIKETIISELTKDVEDVATFLRITPTSRVKELNSLIQKAFYRGKEYSNPFDDITDKVGIRFVVLLVDDIKTLSCIVERQEWESSKDRDFEKERLDNPNIFTYQSVHYIVRNRKVIEFEDIEIPIGTPCEVQIRTLLQHAYSELTHDTVYKPKTRTVPEMHRLIAQSMALIETTDKIFEEVNDMLKANSNEHLLLPELTTIYSSFKEPEFEKGLNIFILDAYKELMVSVQMHEISTYFREHPYIFDLIKKNYDRNLLYRQPIVLVLYYLIAKKRSQVKQHWPLTPALLHPLFVDLGYSF
jgi:ppGpp synthetase/RelA/SpoT-type nucleotidyltranferase